MKPSRAQILLPIAILLAAKLSVPAEPTIGQKYPIPLTDIDGHEFSTADGHFTTIVLVSKANGDKPHAVGERMPYFCLGNPHYRMITVVAFEAQHSRPVRAFLTSMMRRRVDSEAKQLQSRYDKLKIAQNARQNVIAVADFDGAIAAKLDAKPNPALFRVFVFGKSGELLKQWSDLPSAEELAAALKEN